MPHLSYCRTVRRCTGCPEEILDGCATGPAVLVQREWCSFGHKFRDRCGFKAGLESQEVSPVFLQWVDCVWQLWRQFPCAFEFNERFLVTLCYHVYSGRFGNFLYNCEAERVLNIPSHLPEKKRTDLVVAAAQNLDSMLESRVSALEERCESTVHVTLPSYS